MQKNSKSSNVLKFSSPAPSLSPWEYSLPIGNGNVGALVQGGVKCDKIMLTNASAVWKGSVGVLPDITDKLKDVRTNMASKNPVMAGVVLEKAFINKKYQPSKFTSVPLADLVVNQTVHGKLKQYSRSLGMETEEVSVQFGVNQTKFERCAFVSFENDYMYYEFSKAGELPISVELKMEAHDKITAVFNGNIESGIENEKQTLSSSLLGYEFESAGVCYGALARVMVDAKANLQVTENSVRIENAEKILLVIKTYVGKTKERAIEKAKAELMALRQVSYEKAFKAHMTIYQKKCSKVDLSISKEKDSSVENLIAGFDDDSTLIYEKLFNFGKYLFEIGLPNKFGVPLVTGLWGKHYNNEKALVDVSTGLSALYSPAFMLGHEEKVFDCLQYFEKYQDDLKKNAYRIYKSKGYMVPPYFVDGSGLPASIEPKDISTITGGAVVANMFYEYFLYTKDMKFLKTEALPFMTNVADFYINYFYTKENGEVTSCPSFSPFGRSKSFENKQIGVYENSTCDFVVARTLFNNIMNIANIFSVSVEKIVEYQNFLNSLPVAPLERNAIKEYRNEENSVLSSGMMHLYNVFGTKEVQHNGNSLSLAPYLNSLVFKLDKSIFAQNLISLGRLSEMSTILGQAAAASSILKYMISNFMSGNMMFLNSDKSNLYGFIDGDNYFNLTGNMLVCTTIIESLVLDYQNNISILPAKPVAWKEGKISNILTKQNVVVEVSFDDKRGNMTVSMKATKSTKFNVILPRGVKKVKNYTIDPTSPRIDNIMLSSGKSLVLDIKY